MNQYLESLTMTYLLWPLLGLLLVGLGIFIAKKNALLSNKRLIGYVLAAIAVLTLPALLGFLNYAFMPYGYLAISALCLILGWYNTRLIAWVFKDTDYKYRHEIILTLFLQLTGMLFFTLVFNLCNDLQYGLWASTSLLSFVFVSLFVQSYRLFLAIPEPIYTLWKFGDSGNLDAYSGIGIGRLIVVTLEIYKEDGDRKALHLKGKISDNVPFGVWARRLIEDHNQNFPLSPISYTTDGQQDNWIFYVHNSVLLPKRYLDCSLTVGDNRIRDNSFIVAKRIKEYVINSK